MERDESLKKVLSTAYAFLARRSHGTKELEKKLLDKGFEADLVKNIIEALFKRGLLDDYDVAYRWAQSRIRDRCWGSAKVYGFLREKGINGEIIDRVQKEVWEEFSETDIAQKAVDKRFSALSRPVRSKVLSFLRSRGFSASVIYRLVNSDDEN